LGGNELISIPKLTYIFVPSVLGKIFQQLDFLMILEEPASCDIERK
jgi:hypothetical protein